MASSVDFSNQLTVSQVNSHGALSHVQYLLSRGMGIETRKARSLPQGITSIGRQTPKMEMMKQRVGEIKPLQLYKNLLYGSGSSNGGPVTTYGMGWGERWEGGSC